jgi:nucleotide-binding universal stress UspA family protein
MPTAADVAQCTSIMVDEPLHGMIVIATDGTHDSDGAVRAGVALGRQHDVRVELITIVETAGDSEFEGNSPRDMERATQRAIASREGELNAQRLRTSLADHEAPCTITVGHRVDEISRFAERHDASLIVMGVGSHGVLARLLNRHTVMRVAAATAIPILAVPADGLPRHD